MGPLSARCSISRRSAWWLQGVWKLLANPMFTSPCISIGKWKRLLKAPMAVRNQTVAMSCRTYVAPLTSVWWLRLPIKSVLLCLFECHWEHLFVGMATCPKLHTVDPKVTYAGLKTTYGPKFKIGVLEASTIFYHYHFQPLYYLS